MDDRFLFQIFSMLIFLVSMVNSQRTFSCNPNAPCGCSSRPVTMSRILGGETAQNRTWGWSVMVNMNGLPPIGGTLISDSWVLTTAYPTRYIPPSGIILAAGGTSLRSATQVRLAAAVYAHPGYDPDTYFNDIALIRTNTPFNMSDPSVSKICLPSSTVVDIPQVGIPVSS